MEKRSLLPEATHAPFVLFPLVVAGHTDPLRCLGTGKRSSQVPGSLSKVTTEGENKLLRGSSQSLPQVLWQTEE